jgi:hypothetical protein
MKRLLIVVGMCLCLASPAMAINLNKLVIA